jgi:sigma-E factor negative regulatory protein RseC
MIEETARVVALDGDTVWVETQRQSTCGGCAANKGCGTALLAKMLGARRTRIKALNTLAVHVGDQVIIGIKEDALVHGSLMLYAMPILAMLGGGLLGEMLNARLEITYTEALSIVFGLGGLVGSFVWLRRYTAGISKDERYHPVVLRRAGMH